MIKNLGNFFRVARPHADGAITIEPRAIYIVPTGFGMLYFGLLLLLLIGSINYANNLGFLLTFFLTSIGLLAMVHTWRNLAGLRLRCGRVDPVFSGQSARFSFSLDSTDQRLRPDIELFFDRHAMDACDAGPDQDNRLQLLVPMAKRGHFNLGRCFLRTRFPLKLYRAWAYLEPGLTCLVYPNPVPWRSIDYQGLSTDPANGLFRKDISGGEFHGLRKYRVGDPLKHVHWKALARGLDLMSREYESPVSADFWLDWEDTPGPDAENRLGQLCFAVLEASRSGLQFGLRIPGTRISPDAGDHHLTTCLTALTLFGWRD